MPSIVETVKKSYDIAIKNKWLLVPALLLSSWYSQGGGNYEKDSQKISQTIAKEAAVLGTQTQEIAADIGRMLAGVSQTTWIIAIFAIVISITLMVLVNLVARAWAQSALIHGILQAQNNQKVSLSSFTGFAIAHTRDMVLLYIRISLIVLAAFLVVGLLSFMLVVVAGAVAAFSQALAIILSIVGIVLLAGFSIYATLILSLAGPLSARFVALRGFHTNKALSLGFKLAHHHFGVCAKMGLVNLGIVMVSMILVGALAGLAEFFAQRYGLGLFVLLIASITTIILSVTTVITEANWNQWFQAVIGRHESRTKIKI